MFLAPLFLFGLLAIGVPIWLHRVARANPTQHPFASLMFLAFGFLFCFLGVVSEYIGMIFQEVRERPTFIVRETHGLDLEERAK